MKHLEAAGTFSTQASVRSYESGPDGLMKPETVLHWLQEIAEAHASTLGFGYDFVMSRGLAWVEVRLDMAIRRRPAWKETVELRTCTAQASPLQARRNLEVRDAEGNGIIEASCLWAVIDIRRRRPVPLNKYITQFPEAPCDEIVSAVRLDMKNLQPEIREWTAERRDMDFNRHINNAAYLVWAL
ncbi:acyl-[acyl-carrier-protein] thioesterase, partial [Akkermansia sp.]